MNTLISQINHLCSAWKSMFDVTGSVRLEASQDDDHIRLNDHHLCKIKGMELTSSTLDAKHIALFFGEVGYIHVTFSWPEDETPFVSSVEFITPDGDNDV